MTKNYFKKETLLFSLLFISSFTWGQNLVHYWNFNDNASIAAITTPSQTAGGASLVAVNAGTSVINLSGTAQNFDVQNLNARNSDVSGTHLRYDNPIGGALIFTLPTSGYENIIVKFATRRSGSGAGTQSWYYTLDGSSYVVFTSVTINDANPALTTLDLSSITGANNNANFKLKVEFAQGSGGTVGNNRFDNFTLEGTTIGGGDTSPPTATIVPANAAVNIATTTNPTITFRKSTSDGSFLPEGIGFDSLIEGGNLQYGTATGLDAGDINLDGDGFVTPTTSKGPEELVPGQLHDTLDLKVYDRVADGGSIMSTRNYTATASQTEFDLDILPHNIFSLFVKVNGSMLTEDDYEINYTQKR